MAPLSVLLAPTKYSQHQITDTVVLYHLYLFGCVCVSIIGTASLVWILIRGLPTIWVFPALLTVPLPVNILQWRLENKMGYTGWLDLP